MATTREEVPIPEEVKGGDCVVVYSQATGRIRRWLASNSDGEISKVDLLPGEEFLHVASKSGLDLEKLQVEVAVATGKVPANDRYVVVKDGVIVTAIHADPACGDALPGCELIAHEKADATWSFDPLTREFSPPVPTAEEIEISKRAGEREVKA